MAKVNGLFSSQPSGKVGNLVYSSWKGITYIRTKPEYINNPRTPAQVRTRSRFKTMSGLMSQVTDFLRVGFASGAVRMSAYNAALSYNLKHATESEGENFRILFPKLKFSDGKYPGIDGASVGRYDNAAILVKWERSTGHGNDFVTIIIADEDADRAFCYHAISQSKHKEAIIAASETTMGHTLHVYICVTAWDLRINLHALPSVSSSIYAGSVVV